MLESFDGVKISELIVNNKRLKTMEIGRDNNFSMQAQNVFGKRLPNAGYDSPTRGLEEVLSNGTVPQSTVSRPSFTGYSKQRKMNPLAAGYRHDALDSSS